MARPPGVAPVAPLTTDAQGKVWQYVAQIQRGEKVQGVEGLRNLATTESGRKALLANPTVLEPLVNIIQLAGALQYSTRAVILGPMQSIVIFRGRLTQPPRARDRCRPGALPGEDGVAVSLAAATVHSLAEAPGAGPPLAVLSSQVLVPSLLKLSGNGSDTGKQQARHAQH